MKRQFTKHHIIPLSRGGKRNKTNILLKTTSEHAAYHTLFSNLTPKEIIAKLTSGNYQFVSIAEWRAWRALFNHMGLAEAAQIISTEWTKNGVVD